MKEEKPMTRDEMTRIIMQEVHDALAEDDYKTAERIMARVSETRLEKIVEEAIEKAVAEADAASIVMARDFARRSAGIREATRARQEAV